MTIAFSRAKKGDVICFHRSVIGRLDMKRELDGDDKTVLSLMRLSAATHTTLFCAVRALTDEDRYDSVIAFSDGKLLGVSDRISPRAGFCEGGNLRCYDLPCGRTGILIGNDFEYPELWRALALAGCALCYVFNEKKLSPLDEKLLSSLSFIYGITTIAVYYDCSLMFSPDGCVRERKCDDTRNIADFCETRKPKILASKPRLFK